MTQINNDSPHLEMSSGIAAAVGRMCSGCGTTKSIAEIVAENPKAVSCCPEREMLSLGQYRERLLKAEENAPGWWGMMTVPETGAGNWLPGQAPDDEAIDLLMRDDKGELVRVTECFRYAGVWATKEWVGGINRHTVTRMHCMEPIAWAPIPRKGGVR